VMSKLISHWDGDRFCDGYRYSLRIFEARTDPNSLCSRDCFPMFSRFNTINTPSSVPVKSPWSEWSVSHRCPEAELFKVPWAGCWHGVDMRQSISNMLRLSGSVCLCVPLSFLLCEYKFWVETSTCRDGFCRRVFGGGRNVSFWPDDAR
jgi:hypothetical protein